MKKLIAILLILAILVVVSGCETKSQTGALIGGAAGAGVGQAVGGDTTGTLIGAGAGAGLGYIIGGQMEDDDD